MKYINFQRLYIKNFLSVGDEPVEIQFNKGLNIITGINKDKEDRRNGVGKSTLADAIYFAVFGNTIRELKKEHVVNNITQNKCEVVLDFYIETSACKTDYRIVRTLGPTKCYLFINGEDKTRDSISNTSSLIAEIINSSPEVFQNCVIMTVNNTTPFMAKRKIEKRKFIEGIFNLQIFSNMLSQVRTETNEINKDFNVECARYEEISNVLVSYNEQRDNIRTRKQENHDRLSSRKQANISTIKSLVDNIKNIKLVDKNEIDDKIHQLTAASEKLTNNLKQDHRTEIELKTRSNLLTEKANRLGTSDSTCPVCLKLISDHDVELINQEKKTLLDESDTLKDQYEQLSLKIKTNEIKSTKINDSIKKLQNTLHVDRLNRQEIQNIKKEIDQLKELNKQINYDISNLKTDTKSIKELIKSTENKLEDTQHTIDRFKRQLEIYDIIKFVVSEEGVKSYIVKKILQLFNSKLAYYLKKMDANCICVFNEYFEEQIIDEKGKICSYFNFSGAERKNIDLACLFAFMDIRRLQGDVAFNFSIYDELFDSSLDERGVDLVTEILKERAEKYNECIMVISHRKESMKAATGEVIFLQKQQGITTRIETPQQVA